jgi:NAD(P)-dependent dehydrogenase (short-subunit alcohol dehydrogenase family)
MGEGMARLLAAEADCRGLIERAVAAYGVLDVLVNNVGISTRGNIETTTAALYFASDDSACVTGSVLDVEQYPVGAPPNW